MIILGVEVRSRVAVRGVVAAPDVPALHAEAQVDPRSADAQAVLAARARRLHIDVDRVEMRACLSHHPGLAVRTVSGDTVRL